MRDNSCKYDSNEINIYFTGGVTQPENYILNDLWLLSFQDVVWDEHTYELPGVTWNEIHIPNMVGLKGHSAFLIDTNHIFIFGGYNQ